jgi:hypothetical protein
MARGAREVLTVRTSHFEFTALFFNSIAKQQIMSTLPLKSSELDLEVVVGSDLQETFRHHSVILASYSEYIDTMLASPMREQETMRITFPDIEPAVWVRLLQFLEPGGSQNMDVADIVELLPVYEKYQFQGAVKVCDEILESLFRSVTENHFYLNEEAVDRFVSAAKLSFHFSLPRSKNEVVKFARQGISYLRPYANESHIRDLLLILQHDEDSLRSCALLVVGKNDHLGFGEIRALVNRDSFPGDYKVHWEHIKELKQTIERLGVKKVVITSAGSEIVNGIYERDYVVGGKRGAMDFVFTKRTSFARPLLGEMAEGQAVVLEATDPFGKKWQIALVHDGEDTTRTALYVWESHFSTIVPPCHGWSATNSGEAPTPKLENSFH